MDNSIEENVLTNLCKAGLVENIFEWLKICLFNKEKDAAIKDAGDSDILRKARIYNKNSEWALKPYEEAVNAAGTGKYRIIWDSSSSSYALRGHMRFQSNQLHMNKSNNNI